MISVSAIARRSNLFTIDMIAEKFRVSRSTIEIRIKLLKLRPVARILTGKAGHPALGFDAAAVSRIERTLPRVITLN